MEEKIGSNRQHKLILQNRSKGNITGICDVVSFDENAVVLAAYHQGEGASCKPPYPGKGRGGHRGNHRQHGLQFQ